MHLICVSHTPNLQCFQYCILDSLPKRLYSTPRLLLHTNSPLRLFTPSIIRSATHSLPHWGSPSTSHTRVRWQPYYMSLQSIPSCSLPPAYISSPPLPQSLCLLSLYQKLTTHAMHIFQPTSANSIPTMFGLPDVRSRSPAQPQYISPHFPQCSATLQSFQQPNPLPLLHPSCHIQPSPSLAHNSSTAILHRSLPQILSYPLQSLQRPNPLPLLRPSHHIQPSPPLAHNSSGVISH